MHSRAIIASAGASSGFSIVAVLEWARSPSAASTFAFLGSVAATVIGWVMARRQEINRALAAEAAEARDEARRQAFLDALNAAAIGRLARPTPLAPDHVESADDRARRLQIAWPPP